MKTTTLLYPILSSLLILSACSPKVTSNTASDNSMYNMVARMDLKEPIEGLCDYKNVIAVLPLSGNGQVDAQAPKTEEALTQEINSQVAFLKENPTHNDKGMVNLLVNCKGELIRCEMDNETKSTVLDAQLVAIFATMKKWTAGSLKGKPVDTVVLYSFTIENGKISLQ